MPIFKRLAVSFLFLTFSAGAFAAEPSDQAIRRLLEVSEARVMLDGMNEKIKLLVDKQVQQSLAGRDLSPERVAIAERMGRRMAAAMNAEMSWEAMEPMYLRLYKGTFTQEEVDGMTRFYQTKVGQAVVKKMPVLMDKVLVEVQSRMPTVVAKLQQIAKEAIEEMSALDAK
ncbi:MAG: DUF2059 domain-containing protein [Zoogloea sp.]|nr:DUF2059 domain-containing protein [Zoogloea sp.]